MQVPPEVSFHNIEPSTWAEGEIRARIADLERIYDRLTSCRVHVDQRANNSRGTIPPVVRIEMGVPGRPDLVVSHEPEHLQRKYQRPDLHRAISEAFRIAERQLLDLKEVRAGRTKDARHASENLSFGEIAELTPQKDSGFIRPRRAAYSTSIATPCCPVNSRISRAAMPYITSKPSVTPGRSQPRSG